jgi:hypothetical protein
MLNGIYPECHLSWLSIKKLIILGVVMPSVVGLSNKAIVRPIKTYVTNFLRLPFSKWIWTKQVQQQSGIFTNDYKTLFSTPLLFSGGLEIRRTVSQPWLMSKHAPGAQCYKIFYGRTLRLFQVLHSRVGSWSYPQTLD